MDRNYRRECVREHIDLIRLMKCKGLPPEIIEREKMALRTAWKTYKEAIALSRANRRWPDVA
jgi:hypothetical protein